VTNELNQQRIEAADDGIEDGPVETDILEQGIRQIHPQKRELIVIFAGARRTGRQNPAVAGTQRHDPLTIGTDGDAVPVLINQK
jgi:hypothetical protein